MKVEIVIRQLDVQLFRRFHLVLRLDFLRVKRGVAGVKMVADHFVERLAILALEVVRAGVRIDVRAQARASARQLENRRCGVEEWLQRVVRRKQHRRFLTWRAPARALRSHVNADPGTHNFERENREAFYKMLGDHFYDGDATYEAKEIESQNEVKTAEELNVELPKENLDFHKLALAQMANMPSYKVPEDSNAESQDAPVKPTAESVKAIVRLAKYQPSAKLDDESSAGDTKAKFWRITLGEDWTVPVVELWRGTPKGTSWVAADGGRTSAVAQIESLLSDGQRVLAIDTFYVGESKLDDRGYQFALLLSSVGARPLGVQADQLQAVTRWAEEQFGEPVERQLSSAREFRSRH